MDLALDDEAVPFEVDRKAAQADWLRSLPAEVREADLRPRDVTRLLARADQFIRQGGLETLAEMDEDVYRLAAQIERKYGLDAALRCVRDGLVRALLPCVRGSTHCAEAAERVILRTTDSIWRAHSDMLEETIRAQEQQRLHQELMVAKRIQERLLPRSVPPVPGFDMAGRVIPAAEVGGDYWSCKYYADDDIVTIKLADVTGHGMAAATLVSAVKFISGGYYRGAKTAAQVMEQTNRILVRETPNEILVTMVYGWLHPHSGDLSVVNAGHSPVFFLHRGTITAIRPTGMALGMIEARYREVKRVMEPGDVFFTCSDGISEPMATGSLGEEWVRDRLLESADRTAAEIADYVLQEALNVYVTPKDDMSILVLKRVHEA